MANELYLRHNYINKDISILTSHKIREYDMSAGGLNVLINAGALPEEQIKWLQSLPKQERVVQLGLLLRDNKELVDIQNKGFEDTRKRFFESNNVQDSEVLSIKKDAIFLIDKMASVLKFDNVEFREANSYTSYYRLGPVEFYFKNSMRYDDIILDIKHVHPKLELHSNHFLKFLITTFKSIEEMDSNTYRKRLKRFAISYKNRELDNGYYREFNDDSMYKLSLKLSGGQLGLEEFEGSVDTLDIGYNYMHYIIPLLRLVM